jgi:protein-tyrosine phosphatase
MTPHKTVLFLCTGNYYRSRFAEILFNHVAGQRGLSWRAVSAGVAIEYGIGNPGPMSRDTIGRLRTLGIPIDAYLRMPMQVGEADLADADLVIALKEAEHRPLLQERYPGWEDRVHYWHVHDLDGWGPDETLDCIELEVAALVQRLRTQ